MRNKDLVYFGTSKVWKIYPDKNADAIQPRWWHKFIFWKKWNYGEWKIRAEYKTLEELLDNVAGKPCPTKTKRQMKKITKENIIQNIEFLWLSIFILTIVYGYILVVVALKLK